jgi:hypothetical protein
VAVPVLVVVAVLVGIDQAFLANLPAETRPPKPR